MQNSNYLNNDFSKGHFIIHSNKGFATTCCETIEQAKESFDYALKFAHVTGKTNIEVFYRTKKYYDEFPEFVEYYCVEKVF